MLEIARRTFYVLVAAALITGCGRAGSAGGTDRQVNAPAQTSSWLNKVYGTSSETTSSTTSRSRTSRVVTVTETTTTAVDPSACGQPGVTCAQGMNVDSPEYRDLCDRLYAEWKSSIDPTTGNPDGSGDAAIQRYGALDCDQQ